MASPSATERIDLNLRDCYASIVSFDQEQSRLKKDIVDKHLQPLYRKLEADSRLSHAVRSKLVSSFEIASECLDTEEQIIRKALESINVVRQVKTELRLACRHAGNSETLRRGTLMKMLTNKAATIPLFVKSGPTDQAPPLCGSIAANDDYVANPGDMAAALVEGSDGDENWILTEVVKFHPPSSGVNGKYELDDIDEEQKDRHTLPCSKVIHLPRMRACPQTCPEALHMKGTDVIALYPQTTCFYKGVVKERPETGRDDYLVLFEDSSYPDGFSPPLYVAQRYTIRLPQTAT